MDYTSKSVHPSGEICVRGPTVFKGYHKNEQATRETFDDQGFLHTGDIGRWNPNGTLSIIDRKKNLFKLSQGEYIAAEKLEAAYGQSDFCNQVWIYGHGQHSSILAVCVPKIAQTGKLMKEKGWLDPSWEFSMKPDVVAKWKAAFEEHKVDLKVMAIADLKRIADASKFSGLEKPKDIILETEIDGAGQAFSVDNELMTPTFKVRRQQLLQKYKKQLQGLYNAYPNEVCKPDEDWGK
jgi:long-chain acyl-CoA synthetase